MKEMKKWVLNLIVMFFCISAYGQDSLSLYLSMAAKNNSAVLQKFTEYKAALQKVPQVGSLPDPELNVGVFLSPMELIGGNQVADIRLMQMFPWFGVLKNAKDEMSLMAKAKFEAFRDAKVQTFYNVQRSWYELQKVRQNIRITGENIDLLKTVERISLVKFRVASIGKASAGSSSASPAVASGNSSGGNSGMNSMGGGGNSSSISPSAPPMGGGGMGSSASGSGLADIYRIQMERGELENSLALLHSQEQTIVARFNSYLNRPVTTGVITPDKLVVDSSDILPKALSDTLFSGNPMLGMLRYEQQSAEARKKMVTKMGYPMVGVGLNYSLINKNPMSTSEMNGKDMLMPGTYTAKVKAIVCGECVPVIQKTLQNFKELEAVTVDQKNRTVQFSVKKDSMTTLVSLQKAAEGMRLPGKKAGMSGEQAPARLELRRRGTHSIRLYEFTFSQKDGFAIGATAGFNKLFCHIGAGQCCLILPELQGIWLYSP